MIGLELTAAPAGGTELAGASVWVVVVGLELTAAPELIGALDGIVELTAVDTSESPDGRVTLIGVAVMLLLAAAIKAGEKIKAGDCETSVATASIDPAWRMQLSTDPTPKNSSSRATTAAIIDSVSAGVSVSMLPGNVKVMIGAEMVGVGLPVVNTMVGLEGVAEGAKSVGAAGGADIELAGASVWVVVVGLEVTAAPPDGAALAPGRRLTSTGSVLTTTKASS